MEADTGEVALRKESVDRNLGCDHPFKLFKSLSARRAWIEIVIFLEFSLACLVALRKESVDRNLQKLAEAINPS